jgi:hypothetical protein
MDCACNEHGSCNASVMECSDDSGSENEIFRVKRRSTLFDKPTSETKTSTLSEQQVCCVLNMYILESVLAERKLVLNLCYFNLFQWPPFFDCAM